MDVSKQGAQGSVEQLNIANTADRLLRIVMCPPELGPFKQTMSGGRPEATYIIQAYVARGLQSLGHQVTFVIPHYFTDVVCTDDLERLESSPRTWSASRWFEFAEKAAWRIQRWLHVPYLNLFLNPLFSHNPIETPQDLQ